MQFLTTCGQCDGALAIRGDQVICDVCGIPQPEVPEPVRIPDENLERSQTWRQQPQPQEAEGKSNTKGDSKGDRERPSRKRDMEEALSAK